MDGSLNEEQRAALVSLQSITNSDRTKALRLLHSHNWSVETAITAFYDGDVAGDEDGAGNADEGGNEDSPLIEHFEIDDAPRRPVSLWWSVRTILQPVRLRLTGIPVLSTVVRPPGTAIRVCACSLPLCLPRVPQSVLLLTLQAQVLTSGFSAQSSNPTPHSTTKPVRT